MSQHWYRVELMTGEEPYCYFGSCELEADELLKHIASGTPFRLRDIFYYDDMEGARSWRDWDPNYEGSVFINPRYVASLMPMLSDPRKRGGGSGDRPVLNFPK